MSGFTCALRRFDKHKPSERPSCSSLHQENQIQLNHLIALREQQDKGNWTPLSIPEPSSSAPCPTGSTPWTTPTITR